MAGAGLGMTIMFPAGGSGHTGMHGLGTSMRTNAGSSTLRRMLRSRRPVVGPAYDPQTWATSTTTNSGFITERCLGAADRITSSYCDARGARTRVHLREHQAELAPQGGAREGSESGIAAT